MYGSKSLEGFSYIAGMILTDSHTHLYYERDAEKRKDLMHRCIQHGVTRLFLPNVDAASVSMVSEMVSEYPQHCFAMLGLHPCDVKENFQEELALIRRAMDEMKFYAVGEIGIDLYWDKSTLTLQQDALKTQIGWAKEFGVPVVIHCREAFEEVYEILASEAGDSLRGIFHCFTGSQEQAHKIIDLGLFLGVGGVVTYKNSGLDKVIQQLPLEKIVLETDSPYLSPVPFRGKPNESSYLTYIAQKIADLKEISIEEVARITTLNSNIIFGV